SLAERASLRPQSPDGDVHASAPAGGNRQARKVAPEVGAEVNQFAIRNAAQQVTAASLAVRICRRKILDGFEVDEGTNERPFSYVDDRARNRPKAGRGRRDRLGRRRALRDRNYLCVQLDVRIHRDARRGALLNVPVLGDLKLDGRVVGQAGELELT